MFFHVWIHSSLFHSSIHTSVHAVTHMWVFFSLSSTHLPTIHVFSPKFVGMSSSLSYPSIHTSNLSIHWTVYSHVYECFFSQPFYLYYPSNPVLTFSFSYPPIHSSVHLSTHTTINLLIYVWGISYSSSQQANQVLICGCLSISHPSIHLYILCHLGFVGGGARKKINRNWSHAHSIETFQPIGPR